MNKTLLFKTSTMNYTNYLVKVQDINCEEGYRHLMISQPRNSNITLYVKNKYKLFVLSYKELVQNYKYAPIMNYKRCFKQ